MKYKILGQSGLKVSQMCLGAMNWGSVTVGGSTDEEAKSCFDAFVSEGGNFFDTANMYHYGHSSELLGDFIHSERDRFVIATKCTFRPHPLEIKYPNDPNGAGHNRKYLVREVERELQRLKTDYIDVLYLHSWDFSVPVKTLMQTLNDLVRSGKVLHLGATNVPAYLVMEANMIARQYGWAEFDACECQYSLLSRSIEREIIPMCDHLGLSVTVYEGLAGGLLCGDEEEIKQRFNGTAYPLPTKRELALMHEASVAAKDAGCSVPQVALAWLLSKGDNIIPIIGGRIGAHVTDNLGALNVQLPQEVLDRLDEVSGYEIGFPQEMIRVCDVWVYNGQFNNIEMEVPKWYSMKRTRTSIGDFVD